ncbi:MAG: methyltransferase [Candidatus Aenigmarchaeota archaeon]|nr:methyltransferase [Candidatus Aenigmarchaeota archaeon]
MVYEVVGSKDKAVAIIGYGVKNPRKLAKRIMKKHKNIKSVLHKCGERTGTYRLHPCKLIIGDKNTEVIHKENGYSIKLDPLKVYFSPREATERERIAKMVKSGERVLIMFSGASPYAFAIKKKHSDVYVTCVEINPYAVGYANKSVKLNKMNRIKNICADVRKVKLGKFDRIIMPLPETAIKFLDSAYHFAKPGATIHVYTFNNSHNAANHEIANICEMFNIKCQVVGEQKVLPYAPGLYKFRVDLKV